MGRGGIALGAAAALAILAVLAAALIGLARAGGGLDFAALAGPYVRRLVLFSSLQAALSAVLSVGLGALLALALARRAALPGRTLTLALLATAAVLPAIVVVFAVVAVWGRSGFVGMTLRAAGLDPGGALYGLPGILLAHVFMNAPFCARVFLAALEATPPEAFRLASQLGMGPGPLFRHVDWPVLRREAPALLALTFLLCFSSFGVVLTLGGGPDRATLEVAIYQALRLEADFARAAVLASLQVTIGVALTLGLSWLARRPGEAAAAGRPSARPDRTSLPLRWFDGAVLFACALLVLPPLAAVVLGAAAWPSLLEPEVARATATSLAIAGCASFLAVALAAALALGARALRVRTRAPRLADLTLVAAYAPLAVPPFTLVAGLFGLLRQVTDPLGLGPVMVVAVNALMALPYAVRLLEPPLTLAEERHGRLAQSLGMAGLTRLRLVDWPLLKRPLLTALALTAALSLGDFGVVAFFGGPDFVTLPLLVYERLGAYRIDEAGAAALLLSLVIFALSASAVTGRDLHAARP